MDRKLHKSVGAEVDQGGRPPSDVASLVPNTCSQSVGSGECIPRPTFPHLSAASLAWNDGMNTIEGRSEDDLSFLPARLGSMRFLCLWLKHFVTRQSNAAAGTIHGRLPASMCLIPSTIKCSSARPQ